MLRLILLVYITTFVTSKSTNWEKFRFPFRQNHIKQLHTKHEETDPKIIEKNHSVCRTQECFKVAAEFWDNMNKSASPCEDFYEYACGNWARNNPIPPAEMEWDTINKMMKEVEYKIRDFLEEETDSNELLPVKQVKKFYKSCMNVDALETTGLKPLEAILFRNGGWPLIMETGEWFEENVPWQQIDNYYSRLTQSSFYSFEITKDQRNIDSFLDLRNENSSVIELKLPELPPVITLGHGMKFDRNKMYDDASYAKFIKEIAFAFIEERSAHVSEEKLDEDIEDLIEFEKKLGAKEKNLDGSVLFTSLEYLEDICSLKEESSSNQQINWEKAFSNLFSEVNIELSGTEEFSLSPEVKKYLKNLCTILGETKPRTIVNYIHWNFLSQLLPHTTSKMREIFYEFKKHLTGVKTEKPRWETCVHNIKMNHAISYHFVMKYFNETMREEGIKMFKSIRKSIIKRILKSDWLSESMKKIEIDKIINMGTIVGYPDWYDNKTAFLNYYRGMPIGHQYLDNILMYKLYSLKKSLRYLTHPELDLEWFPTLVNAAYNRLYNELSKSLRDSYIIENIKIFPAAVFQYPFYSAAQPETVNFGGLGFIMGHEVAHGFDIKGLMFDKNGNYIRWPEEDGEQVESKSICFVSQYGKFYGGGNDESWIDQQQQTMGEDMADSLGINVVFEAFEEIENEKNEPRLPGFEELTNEQMFFLTFAKVWCSSTTPEYEELVKKEDVHGRPRYRVIATVQNSEGFSKAYKCPKGSPMNPEEKCKIL